MMSRHLRRRAGAFAWPPHWDGRWVLALILSAYFATLMGLARSRGLEAAWRTLGVAADPHPFLDARFITATANSYRAGYDPYVENPCDPYGRRMNYPRIWLAPAALGLGREHTIVVGIAMALAYFGSLLGWAGRQGASQGLILGVFLCAPHIMWIIERGNADQVIFILLATSLACVRRYPKSRPILYAAIIASSILKYYPVAGMLAVARERSWRAPFWGLVILVAFISYLLITWPDPLLVIRATGGYSLYRMAYGRTVLFEYLAAGLRSRAGLEVPGSIIALCSWMAVGIALLAGALWARRIPPISGGSVHLDSFLVGSGIFLGTYLIGNNFDYKLAFLVFLLPQTIAWIRDGEHLARPAYLLLASLMCTLWIEPLFSSLLRRNPWYPFAWAFLLQELINWVIFTLIFSINLAILRGWVERWRRDDGGTAPAVRIGRLW